LPLLLSFITIYCEGGNDPIVFKKALHWLFGVISFDITVLDAFFFIII